MKFKSYLFLLVFGGATLALADNCVDCHSKITPGAVTDWELSKHFANAVTCDVCHGDGHQSAEDVSAALIPTPETCANCHEDRVNQFKAGKHAIAWAALKAMPTTHYKPMELIDGMKGCGGCHKIGLKSEAEIVQLKEEGQNFGMASCDACHTRHTFSVEEARQPQACKTCHMGFDHPQWEMYSSSKHGVRNELKQLGILPDDAAAPTCQTCHMPDGNHEVRTAWGFLAVRTNGLAPYPGESDEWWADRVTILQGLGVLDPEGNPTGRLDVVAQADVARLSAEAFDKERQKMLDVCSQCHSDNFARGELEKTDNLIREGDKLMAEAIRIVAGLYRDGLLEKPDNYAYAFPDLLTFHDAPTTIEQRLFTMHLKHRMRLFQGSFHASPDYALWYGWNEMVQDLTEIRTAAEEMRKDAQPKKKGFFGRK
ncbi:MAG: cytochrome C [FCB group bacterium]|nr:cytochrome C [FCB group bacterium]